jgi:hypothetical protein
VRLEAKSGTRSRRQGRRVWPAAFRKAQNYQMALLVALGLCLLGAAGFVLARSAPAFTADDGRGELREVTHQAVRNAIPSALQTAFSGDAETHIEALPDGKFVISGWVDLIGENGSSRRNTFTCRIYKNQSGEWALDDLSLIPQ